MTEDIGKQASWRLRLLELDFDVVHRAGVHYCVPVVLAVTKVDNEHPPTLQHLLEVQALDPECRQTLENGDKPRSNFTMDTNGLPARVELFDGPV